MTQRWPAACKLLASRRFGIREGASADFVGLDANDPSLLGRKGDALLDSWIFAGAQVDCVWRGGRKVVIRRPAYCP